MAPALCAPSSRATSGAALGSRSSGATVARSTRSSSSGSTSASSSAPRAAARASASRRSPSRTWRRSCTPVRWTIHCSVTPAPAATVSLVTTFSGTAIATDASAAARGRRASHDGLTSEGRSRSWPWLCICGLHGERGLGLHVVERLAHQVREHATGARLHVARGAEVLQRAHHAGPADRADDRLHQLLAYVLERRGGDAGEHGHARRAHLHVVGQPPERL